MMKTLGGLSKLRNWQLDIEGKKVRLFPEYELTDYPPRFCMNAQMAKSCMRHGAADISIAGFVETDGKKRFSSCVVIDGRNEYIVRKYEPFRTEVGTISGNDEKSPVLPLSIGNTVIMICADLRLFMADDHFLSHCRQFGTKIGILLSAWKHGFRDAIELMRGFRDKTGLMESIIVDRFNGLIRINE